MKFTSKKQRDFELANKTHSELKAMAKESLENLSRGTRYTNGLQAPPFTVPNNIKLLSTSYKVEKSLKNSGVRTGILYLAPADSAGITRGGHTLNICPWATDGCKKGCLIDSGHMRMSPARNARLWRTALYAHAPELLKALLIREIDKLRSTATTGEKVAVRLDGTSDLGLAELWNFPSLFPDVQFYDYTKSQARIIAYDRKRTPNMHYTFSASEAPDSQSGARYALDRGLSVAQIVPAKFEPTGEDLTGLVEHVTGGNNSNMWDKYGFPLIHIEDGDNTDARFLDKPSTIVYLKAKGGSKVERNLGGMVYNV